MAEQELKKISQEELDEILAQHKLWVESLREQGKRADLSYCDLRGLKFPKYVNLIGANLFKANLFKANLEGAFLAGANLEGANLEGANLRYTILENKQSENLAQEIIQHKLKVSQLEHELKQAKSENNQSQEQQEQITRLEKQLELAKQAEEELQEIKKVLDNIDNANTALTTALKNTDEQIKNNQEFAQSLQYWAKWLIVFDIALVLLMPILLLYGKFDSLLDKVNIWGILFFTFPAVLILLIALSLLRHQKQLIAEIRHYSMLKHKIELYGGILKAAQYMANSVIALKNSDNAQSAEYIQKVFDEIKAELLKSPNFDLNSQPHIFPEEGGNIAEVIKSTITECMQKATSSNK